MWAYLYICIYIYMYIYIYINICVYIYIYVDIYLYANKWKYIYIYMYIHIYIHKYIYICMYVYIYIYIYIFVCVYIYIYIHMYICIYIEPNNAPVHWSEEYHWRSSAHTHSKCWSCWLPDTVLDNVIFSAMDAGAAAVWASIASQGQRLQWTRKRFACTTVAVKTTQRLFNKRRFLLHEVNAS